MFLTMMYDLYQQMFNSWQKIDTIGWGKTDCNYAPPWIFLPLGIVFDYWIEHRITRKLAIFICNLFLSDKACPIHLGTILYDKIFHQEGVPRGSNVSTTLFNIKINDIVKQVDPGVECSLYVDDFVIM